MREKMVTRTIVGYRVEMTGIDITKSEIVIKLDTLNIPELDETKLLKVCKKRYDTDTFKLATAVILEKVENLYGMPEERFMEYAVLLDPETRKPLF